MFLSRSSLVTCRRENVTGVGRTTAGPSTTLQPDFLSRLVALANFMRLSLRKAADALLMSAA
jgi:hypothetical protein